MNLRRAAHVTKLLLLAAWLPLYAIGLLFHFAIPAVAHSISPQFGNAALFRPWDGWTSTYMALHPLGFGVVFVAVFWFLWRRGGVTVGWRGGLVYGLGVFLVGSLPVFAAFQVSMEVIASWVVQSACQYLAAGAAVGRTASRSTQR